MARPPIPQRAQRIINEADEGIRGKVDEYARARLNFRDILQGGPRGLSPEEHTRQLEEARSYATGLARELGGSGYLIKDLNNALGVATVYSSTRPKEARIRQNIDSIQKLVQSRKGK